MSNKKYKVTLEFTIDETLKNDIDEWDELDETEQDNAFYDYAQEAVCQMTMDCNQLDHITINQNYFVDEVI